MTFDLTQYIDTFSKNLRFKGSNISYSFHHLGWEQCRLEEDRHSWTSTVGLVQHMCC